MGVCHRPETPGAGNFATESHLRGVVGVVWGVARKIFGALRWRARREEVAAVVAVVNAMVVLVAIGLAAVVAGMRGPRETRRRWGWGFRLGPFFFWRR